MVKYCIKDNKANCQEITEDKFSKLKEAKKCLFESLFIEEKLDLVFANYLEIEKEVFNLSLNQMIKINPEWSKAMDEKNILNLRIVNFLSTTRLYIDQMKHSFSEIYGKESNQYTTIENKCSEEYDSNLGYRAIEAIRNHVQHYDLPVYDTKLSMKSMMKRLQKSLKKIIFLRSLLTVANSLKINIFILLTMLISLLVMKHQEYKLSQYLLSKLI